MRVYVAVFGYAYDGADQDTIRVFTRREDAEVYTRTHRERGHAWFEIVERDVE